MKFRPILAAGLALGALLSCSDSESLGPGQGRIAVRMTDSPFPLDDVASIDIFVVRVEAKTQVTTEEDAALDMHRGGNENSHDSPSPGRSTYEAITLERGITHDAEFERWANLVHPYAGDAAMDLVNYKQELTLEVMNEKGHVALRYFLHRCWVSEFVAVPDLDSMANVTAIESVKLELEGWERDVATVEPDEASAVPVGA